MTISENDFANTIKPWSVYYFTTIDVHSTIPHYFVVINQNINNSPILVLPVATSQLEKRKKYYNIHTLEKDALVIVNPKSSNWILTKKSAFDCNFTKIKTIKELYEVFSKWKLKYIWILPEEIINKLRNWVKAARQVENWIKDLV